MSKRTVEYSAYPFSFGKRVVSFLGGFLVGMLLGIIFYGLFVMAVLFGILTGFLAEPFVQKWLLEKRQERLSNQFRDMLEALSTAIGSGEVAYQAFRSARKSLTEQYSEKTELVQELDKILQGVDSNINLEDSLLDFAKRSGLEDIQTFANVFAISYRKGGDMKEIIRNTYQILNDKMEIDREIRTMTTSSRTEMNMMLCMPVLIKLFLNTSGSSLMSGGGALSFLATTGALVLFALAYVVGRKVCAIKL